MRTAVLTALVGVINQRSTLALADQPSFRQAADRGLDVSASDNS